jgi:glutaredoxin|tara:strand:- start:2581 stop:2949 length:369 start_codon:yes stop_codon:yes gene_type:complete
MLLKLVREGLGRLIVAIDWVFSPKKVQRNSLAQNAANTDASTISLYQFYACPFCIKTRRAIRRLNIKIVTRDAQKPGEYRQELSAEGGRVKVPCLRIEKDGNVEWMYESKDIINYLDQRFAA